MEFIQAIKNRWQREEQERIEKDRVFDVHEDADRLVLKRRLGSFTGETGGSVLIAFLWVVGNWHIYQSPLNRSTWVGWIILWCSVVPLAILPSLIEAWRFRQGDAWVIDASNRRIERNGTLIGTFDQMKAVRLKKQPDGEGGFYFLLALVPSEGKPIILSEDGEEQELADVARLMARTTQLPLETK